MTTKNSDISREEFQLYKFKFQAPDLTIDQAKLIYEHEKYKSLHSTKYFLTDWDEWDYELTALRKILNVNQLKHYEVILAETIKKYELQLLEDDKKMINEIACQNECLRYHEDIFFLTIFSDMQLLTLIRIIPEKTKIDFLRSEYKKSS